jgi:hypothetical protein
LFIASFIDYFSTEQVIKRQMGRQYVMIHWKGCGGKFAWPMSWNLPTGTEEKHEIRLVRIAGIMTGI